MGNQSNSWVVRAGLDRDGLQEMYLRLSDVAIGAQYGVSGVVVSRVRRRWGIPTITSRQRKDALEGRVLKLEDLTPVQLSSLYSQMGDRAVASLYGVSAPAIRRLRKQWGIQAISKSERATSTSGFTEEQKELCIGTLLGDGHLLSRGVLKVTHSSNQLTYLRRLWGQLAPHVLPLFYEEKRMPSGNVAFAFGFRSVQHVWLKALRDLFYPQGHKVFPESILEDLSPRSLAYWYWDDGHLDSGLPSIALGKVSQEEAERVVEQVGARFNLDVYLKPQSTPSCQLLGIRARSTDPFFFLIREHVTPDLLHKLPSKHRPSGVIQKVPVVTRAPVKLPKGLRDRCRGWVGLGESQQASLLAEVAAFWQGEGFPHCVPKPEEVFALHAVEQDQVLQGGVLKPRQVGQATCHAFHPHIWEARNHESRMSPMDLFQDTEQLQRALRTTLDFGGVPEAARVRSALRYYRRSGVYNFRPAVAKVLVDRFCCPGGAVWDPCAGYGGRMFGALLSRSRPTYIACEPQAETFARLHLFRDWLDTFVPGSAGRVNLHEVPAEEFDPPDVDMVLTSPPYWKKERYGEAGTQSGVRYSTYPAWLAGFWKLVIEKAVQALRPGGWLALNVDDFRIGKTLYPLIEDTRSLVAEAGLGDPSEVLSYAMPIGKNQDNAEVVLCWAKGGTTPDLSSGEPDEEIGVAVCGGCDSAFSVVVLRGGLCPTCRKPKHIIECRGCGMRFEPSRKAHLFHDKACHARWRRRRHRMIHPPKETRRFVCQACEQPWETKAKGHFTLCPVCKEAREVEARSKVCAYRHCGVAFTDTSVKNTMKFCQPKHRNQEKRLRLLGPG